MYTYKNVLIEKKETNLVIRNPNQYVLKDFDVMRVIGRVKLKLKDGKLYGDFELNEKGDKLYPSIGVQYFHDDNNIKKCLVTFVGLCSQPNSDPEILRL